MAAAPTVVCQRTTITGGGLKGAWVPDNVADIEGKLCLQLSYSDRKLAQYCGIGGSDPHPLQKYLYLDTLRAARHEKTVSMIVNKFAEKDPMGSKTVKYALAHADQVSMDTFVSVPVPAVTWNDETMPAMELTLVADVVKTKMVQLELTSTSLAYLRLGILAGGERARGRKRGERFDAPAPGVHWDYRRESLFVKAVDFDGREHRFYKKPRADDAVPEIAAALLDVTAQRAEIQSVLQ